MREEGDRILSEFETVVKRLESTLKTIVEDIEHIQIKSEVGFYTLKEQVALIYEVQTEIKRALMKKVDQDEFMVLEKRLTGLENKGS